MSDPHPDRHPGCGGLWVGGRCERCAQVVEWSPPWLRGKRERE